MSAPEAARLAMWPEDYQRFGLNEDSVQPSENGMRTAW
jgi:hypothetical protein